MLAVKVAAARRRQVLPVVERVLCGVLGLPRCNAFVKPVATSENVWDVCRRRTAACVE